MSLQKIIETELKLDVDKAELELERIINIPDLDIDTRVKMIKESISNWGKSMETLKYWMSFVEERIEPKNDD